MLKVRQISFLHETDPLAASPPWFFSVSLFTGTPTPGFQWWPWFNGGLGQNLSVTIPDITHFICSSILRRLQGGGITVVGIGVIMALAGGVICIGDDDIVAVFIRSLPLDIENLPELFLDLASGQRRHLL